MISKYILDNATNENEVREQIETVQDLAMTLFYIKNENPSWISNPNNGYNAIALSFMAPFIPKDFRELLVGEKERKHTIMLLKDIFGNNWKDRVQAVLSKE